MKILVKLLHNRCVLRNHITESMIRWFKMDWWDLSLLYSKWEVLQMETRMTTTRSMTILNESITLQNNTDSINKLVI